MRVKQGWMLLVSTLLLAACQTDSGDNDIINTSTSEPTSESVSQVSEEDKTIRFLSGVTDATITGDQFNYYAIEGKADGFERVTAIIEGTAVDIRNTDDEWQFTYPYPGPNVETAITFTTDQTIEYGQSGIDLNDLEPETYVTLTFIPNNEPEIKQPSVTTKEGQPHTFRNSDSTIVEIVTVVSMELVDSKEAVNPLGDQLLKVTVQYVNDGTVTTHIAPNYFSALDGEGHFLPLRYSHFWLIEVPPGQSFTETIYFDVNDEGPYSVQFFDGAWNHSDGITGTSI